MVGAWRLSASTEFLEDRKPHQAEIPFAILRKLKRNLGERVGSDLVCCFFFVCTLCMLLCC